MMTRHVGAFLLALTAALALPRAQAPSISYPAGAGPGGGRHVVLLSGDEEYRGEEALPMLAKILSRRHGFKTTVLFAVDPGRHDQSKQPEVHCGLGRPRFG